MKRRRVDLGFTIVEVIAALIVITTGLAFLSLLFTQQRLNTINNEVRSGAVVFSQKILDSLRQKDPNTLPQNENEIKQCPPLDTATPGDISLCPTNLNNSNPYLYKATLKFSIDEATCKDNCRKVKLTILRDNVEIYIVETIYTKFE